MTDAPVDENYRVGEPSDVVEPHQPWATFTELDELIEYDQALGGRYRLNTKLFQRGSVATWQGYDDMLSRPVLIHILPPGDPKTDEVLATARTAAVATDSRYLRVLDALEAGPSEPVSFVVCEHVSGLSLTKILKVEPLGAFSSAWLVHELADALSTMHDHGLFHRQLSPETVLITSSGNIKITGFLVEAAFYPDPHLSQLTFSEVETLDVVGLGKVFYACLSGFWPGDLDKSSPQLCSLPLAPRSPDGTLWPPAVVRPDVSPVLDAICRQILDLQPDSRPLRTSREIANALKQVLGSDEATANLEHRVQAAMMAAEVESSDLALPASADRDESVPTTSFVAESETRESLSFANKSIATKLVRNSSGFSPHHPAGPLAKSSSEMPQSINSPRHTTNSVIKYLVNLSTPHRRWLTSIILLLTLAITITLSIRACQSNNTPPVSAQGIKPISITSATAFDPIQDGGNGDENSADTKFAIDKDRTTSWQSVSYLNNPVMGGYKSGVGIVLDLGSVFTLAQVNLELVGEPTSIELMIPAENPDAASPPLDTVSSWHTLTTASDAKSSITLTPEGLIKTRWVLIYLTKLPSVGSNRYRGGVAEVSVLAS